jgi:RND family efflux transporter MFP subunit
MKRGRLWLVAAALVVLALGGIALAGRGRQAIPVRETIVRYRAFVTKLPETGVVQVPRLVTIPAGVPGTLAQIDVRAGERVAAGQLLATILNEQISSNLTTARDSAASAAGRARSVAATSAALPAQNRSSVVQAQAAVVAARSQLTQARQDLAAGAQSGLGYGGQTAEEQRLSADTELSKAKTELGEAKRTLDANQYLFDQKGLSHDALLQSQARYDQALASYHEAASEREILGGQLAREQDVLRDRVRSAQDALQQALAALEAADAQAHASKAGDLQAADADAALASADLAFARDQAARLEVRAPLAGTVESVAAEAADPLRPLQPGDAITAGMPLFSIAPQDDLVVRTRVDEQDIAAVRIGQRALVSGEDFNGATLEGRVIAIAPMAQRSDDPANTSRQIVTTIALRKRLPFLRDGMSADVDIVTREQQHVLVVPVDALGSDDGGSFVYAIADGRARRTTVSVGAQNDSEAIVTAGLHDGDAIVAEKKLALSDGAPVTPAPSTSPGPVPSDAGD